MSAEVQKQSATSQPLFDADELARLHAEIGTAGISRLLGVYQLDLERRMQRMETAFSQLDYATLARECHALRAASSALGLTRFANELQLLEAVAKQMAASAPPEEPFSAAQQHRHLQLVLAETRPYLVELATKFSGALK